MKDEPTTSSPLGPSPTTSSPLVPSHTTSSPLGPSKRWNRFRQLWEASTADNNLTLHGFRRFKTTHLLNLRYLEHEIAQMDHTIYQLGLSMDVNACSSDRLHLKFAKKAAVAPDLDAVLTDGFIARLRDVLKHYDEALISFNKLMTMETFALIDDEKQASLRDDLTLPEMFKTRLVRTDLETRTRTDPFQRWLHRHLRTFRYWRLKAKNVHQESNAFSRSRPSWSYQNTILVADVVGRISTASLVILFLVVPLALLSRELSQRAQLIIVASCITFLTFLVSLTLKVSSFEIMAVSAAYAAVLSVFVSSD